MHSCYDTIFDTIGLPDTFRIAADDTYRQPRYLKCHMYLPARYRKYRYRSFSTWIVSDDTKKYRSFRHVSFRTIQKSILRFDTCRNKRY